MEALSAHTCFCDLRSNAAETPEMFVRITARMTKLWNSAGLIVRPSGLKKSPVESRNSPTLTANDSGRSTQVSMPGW